MKLFERTGGHWLFWLGAFYLTAGLADVFYLQSSLSPYIQVVWLLLMAFPFICPPFGRWLNLRIDWDKHMFDWFKKKEPSNVVPFPKPEAVPHVAPPAEPEKPAKIFYRLGVTDNNRLAFQMGYSEITMNKQGVQNLIDQLETFRDQLSDGEE